MPFVLCYKLSKIVLGQESRCMDIRAQLYDRMYVDFMTNLCSKQFHFIPQILNEVKHAASFLQTHLDSKTYL